MAYDPAPPSVLTHLADFQRALLSWFAHAGRALPWRDLPAGQRDPYRSWVAEILLQQTQMSRGLPYYQRFLQRFPDVHALAQAPIADVLKAWEGCGYYARARHLHSAAAEVAASGFPQNYHDWQALRGVGPYTAAALSSLTLGEDRAVSDGNVRRVLARLLAQAQPSPKWVQQWADQLLPSGQAGQWNEALMDLGATICTPKAPQCGLCPVAAYCRAQQQGQVSAYPAAKVRASVKAVSLLMLIVHDPTGPVQPSTPVYLPERRGKLLGGLAGLPSAELESEQAAKQQTEQALSELLRSLGLTQATEIGAPRAVGQMSHTMTHRQIGAVVYAVAAPPHLPLQDPTQAALSRLDQKALELWQRGQSLLLSAEA